MSNAPIDRSQVQDKVERRENFWAGVYRHFGVYVVVNIIVWGAWLLLVHDGSFPAIPIIVSGSWAVILIVHAVLVFFSHKPGQVAHDEVDRQHKEQQVMGRR